VWRHCGKQGDQLICTIHCKTCEHKGEAGDVHHCKYYIGRTERQKVDVSTLKRQIAYKEQLASKYYAQNKPKVAENIVWDMVALQTKLKEAECEKAVN